MTSGSFYNYDIAFYAWGINLLRSGVQISISIDKYIFKVKLRSLSTRTKNMVVLEVNVAYLH